MDLRSKRNIMRFDGDKYSVMMCGNFEFTMYKVNSIFEKKSVATQLSLRKKVAEIEIGL